MGQVVLVNICSLHHKVEICAHKATQMTLASILRLSVCRALLEQASSQRISELLQQRVGKHALCWESEEVSVSL